MSLGVTLWVVFGLSVLGMLILDLGVFNRKAHDIKLKEALVWSVIWTVVALMFNGGVYFALGSQRALEFFVAYLLERSLSIDNLFIFLLVFAYFKVPRRLEHKVLFWGILGALIMRAVFIVAGIAFVRKFQWAAYVLGGLVIFTGIKMLFQKDHAVEPSKNILIRLARKVVPMVTDYSGDRFFVRHGKAMAATPLFIVLLVVESTDVIFAADSIPAVLGITVDPFVVYSSNVFAILGMRALYFALAGAMQMFHHLNYGLAVILVFIGAKMIAKDYVHHSIVVDLLIIASILLFSVATSVVWPKKDEIKA